MFKFIFNKSKASISDLGVLDNVDFMAYAFEVRPPDDRDMFQALYSAVNKNHYNIVSFLLEHKADPNYQEGEIIALATNNILNPKTPYNRYDIITLLLEYGTVVSDEMLIYSIMENNFELLKLFIKYGGNPNADEYTRTALSAAIENNNFDIVKYLLDAGADPNLKIRHKGLTPLQLAQRESTENIVSLLISYGAR